MRRAAPLLLGCFLVATAGSAQAPAKPPAQTFRAVHLFNLPSAAAEAQVLGAVAELNQAIARAGHPEIRYSVWKVHGEKQGAHTYLWESLWPDGATYDKVHAHSQYVAAMERVRSTLDAAVGNRVYNRYTELPVAPPGR